MMTDDVNANLLIYHTKIHVKEDLLRSGSEGSTDDESELKRKLPRSFHV